jgi:Alginate lyase
MTNSTARALVRLLGAMLLCGALGGCEAPAPGPNPPDSNPPDANSPGGPGAGQDGSAPAPGADGSLALADGGGGFTHPGVLVNQAQLDFVKAQVAAGVEPWKSAFAQTNASSLASLSYTPHPVAIVQCGPYSNPDVGCTDEKNDAAAAYTHALLWSLTGDAAHAQKSIDIMNAWSKVLTAHQLSNAPLQSAWVGSVFPRAAEIIRHTGAGWSAADVAAFEALLRNVYLPEVIHGSGSNGNWELSMAEASIAIGVFLDDQSTFDSAVTMWKKRVPAYVYLTSDGATPVPPPTGGGASLKTFWYNPTNYVDGLAQETCRDFGHVQYGLAAMTNAAETARIQGVDLYSLESKRITTGYEFHARYLNGDGQNPNGVCGAALNALTPDPMWEIGYNEYANRLGMALPETLKLINTIRPTGSDHHMQWETLTHAEVGSVGIP